MVKLAIKTIGATEFNDTIRGNENSVYGQFHKTCDGFFRTDNAVIAKSQIEYVRILEIKND